MSLYLDPENIEEVENEVHLLMKKYGTDEVLRAIRGVKDFRDDRIERALKVLRMTHEPDNDEHYSSELASFFSQLICEVADILEGKD